MEKFELNGKRYNIYVNDTKDLYIVDVTKNDNLQIETVKEVIETKFNILINYYFEGRYKRYAKDNYKESEDYSFVFSTRK